jgi:hypothetical protein
LAQWLVNSVVAGSLLLLIVAANILVQKFPGFPYVAAYAGIFISPDLSASNHGVVPLLGDERSGVRNVNQRWT